jgi:hypothetical protein
MKRIRNGLVTAGLVAAMSGGGAIGAAVAFGATGTGSSSTTTTTTPSVTIAPSTGTTTTPSQGSGNGQGCPDHGAAGNAAGSTAAY